MTSIYCDELISIIIKHNKFISHVRVGYHIHTGKQKYPEIYTHTSTFHGKWKTTCVLCMVDKYISK